MDRRVLDGAKLLREFTGDFVDDDITNMVVDFDAPENSLYHGFRFKVAVELEEGYPNKAPIVHFVTKILHPNIDYDTGYPCLSALENENWNDKSKLEHIFSLFLPQLLCFPNFDDPYNEKAYEMYENSKEDYERAVKETCEKHAKKI